MAAEPVTEFPIKVDAATWDRVIEGVAEAAKGVTIELNFRPACMPRPRSRRKLNEGWPTRRELRRFAKRVLRATGLAGWKVATKPMPAMPCGGVFYEPGGACDYPAQAICLAPVLLELERHVGKLTVLHEIAHALGWPHHGPEFMCAFADLVKRFMGGEEAKADG